MIPSPQTHWRIRIPYKTCIKNCAIQKNGNTEIEPLLEKKMRVLQPPLINAIGNQINRTENGEKQLEDRQTDRERERLVLMCVGIHNSDRESIE